MGQGRRRSQRKKKQHAQLLSGPEFSRVIRRIVRRRAGRDVVVVELELELRRTQTVFVSAPTAQRMRGQFLRGVQTFFRELVAVNKMFIAEDLISYKDLQVVKLLNRDDYYGMLAIGAVLDLRTFVYDPGIGVLSPFVLIEDQDVFALAGVPGN